jgi:hypothetical protein
VSNETFQLDAGVDWLSNLADANGLEEYISATAGTIEDSVEGFSVHATVSAASFIFTGEYVAALDDFALGEINFKGSGARPAAWNLEAAYETEIINRGVVFGLGYQGTDEAVALELPESRIMVVASVEICPYTSLALEYFHDEDYSTGDGGTGGNGDTVTMQLALEF